MVEESTTSSGTTKTSDCPPPPKKAAALALTESLRLETVDVLANLRTRRIVVGFLPRNPATLVTNSWRLAKNQQTTRVKCDDGMTDALVNTLATHCPGLDSINLSYCRDITDEAIATLRESHPGVHIEEEQGRQMWLRVCRRFGL